MLKVGIEMSSAWATLSLHSEKSAGVEVCLSEPHQHLENFIPCLQNFLASQNIKVQDVGCFVVGTGPGSFTGLRIALSAVKAFAFCLNVPLVTVSTSEARAIAWLRKHPADLRFTVSTQVGVSRWVYERYENQSGKAVLVDVIASETREESCVNEQAVPASASLLVECYPEAHSARVAESLKDLVEATPNYFGERGFKKLS